MSIVYHESSKIFHLYNQTISYIMMVLPNGHMGQLYYGKKIRDKEDFSYLLELAPRDMASYLYENDRTFSLGHIKLEYGTYGSGDYRHPAVEILQNDGSTYSDFQFTGYQVTSGKPKLPGLPATYTEQDGEAETLIITLKDTHTNLELHLLYTIFVEGGVIARSASISNQGDISVQVQTAMSLCLDLPDHDYEWMQFSGAWARERALHTRRLEYGIQAIDSTRGHSSHEQNPFIILKRPSADEFQGEAIGCSLIYSGNFLAQAEVESHGTTRLMIGINPFGFSWELNPGETFQTPEAVLVYSSQGLNDMSQTFHRLYRRRLARGYWRDRERPILINNWEATYFNFTEEKLLQLASRAQKCGIELFVLDDGWFGARSSSKAGLGDWEANRDRLSNGLSGLAQKIEALGMKFGLWIEPEMVNPKSELAEKHPDWIVRPPKREAPTTRNQWLLDLTNPKVQDFVFGVFDNTMKLSDKIDYIKWDANRNANNVGSAYLPADEQSRFWIDYAQGFYKVMERIRAKYPDVLIQACASGGGRVEYGALKYFDEVWTSDNTEALSRARIQYGTSLFYPAVVMGSHVSATPNHQTGNITPIKFRFDMACAGRLGMELQPRQMTDEERQFARRAIASYKEYRDIVMQGDLYRIGTPYDKSGCYGLMYVSKDRKQAVLFTYSLRYQGRSLIPKFRLQGLDPKTGYTIRELNVDKSRNWFDGKTFSGEMLSNAGINPSMPKIYDSGVFLLTAE